MCHWHLGLVSVFAVLADFSPYPAPIFGGAGVGAGVRARCRAVVRAADDADAIRCARWAWHAAQRLHAHTFPGFLPCVGFAGFGPALGAVALGTAPVGIGFSAGFADVCGSNRTFGTHALVGDVAFGLAFGAAFVAPELLGWGHKCAAAIHAHMLGNRKGMMLGVAFLATCLVFAARLEMGSAEAADAGVHRALAR